jgi:hypothetical protein
MARRSIKIKVRINKPDDFLALCEAVLKQHLALGAASPFAAGDLVDMAAFQSRLTQARQKRNEALQYYAMAEAAMAQSRHLMGSHTGQSSDTPGTLLNSTLNIKKILLALNTTNPEALSEWGFDVVVRLAKSPKSKKKTNG